MDATQDQLADLAEAVLSVARRLTILGNRDSGALALSPLEALVMRHIDRSPGCTPSELAAHLGLKTSNASTALRELEAKGFVTRSIDPADGRSVRVHPTALARANRDRKRESWASALSTRHDDWSALKPALTLLEDLDKSLDDALATRTARAQR